MRTYEFVIASEARQSRAPSIELLDFFVAEPVPDGAERADPVLLAMTV
jgi:hypothetical protein